MTASTSVLTLKTAIGSYGHHAAIKDGSVGGGRIAFDCVEVSPITAAFRRMCRNLEFDISEMAITTYLTAKAYGKPFTAIPIFPVRNFAHGATMVNTKSGVTDAKGFEGKKVGVRAYTVTTGVWARGLLADEYGLDLDKVDWELADEEHVDDFHKDAPKNAHYNLGADLSKQLVDGELAGGIGLGRFDSEDIKPLLPGDAAKAYYEKTGIYPINHTLVIKDSLLAENPWLAEAVFEAFKAAKEKAAAAPKDAAAGGERTPPFIQGDPLPYGIEANRKTLETIIRYANAQHITPAYKVEDIFVPSTHKLS